MRQYLLTWEENVIGNEVEIIRRLDAIGRRVLLRIPIQEHDGTMDEPAAYEDAFVALKEHADLMIEFVDSDAAARITEAEYAAHVTKCLAVLGRHCTVAEAGNEINGANWTKHDRKHKHPHPPAEVVQMVGKAVEAAHHFPLITAVTYYLSTDEQPPMLEWMRQYALNLKSDYGLISYYPNSAEVAFTRDELFQAFTDFGREVKAAQVGWGEYGLNGKFPHESSAKDLVSRIEEEFWPSFSAIPKYEGFGGFWEWQTHSEVDQVLKHAWSV